MPSLRPSLPPSLGPSLPSLTHSLTHSFIHSLTHSLIQSLTASLAYSVTTPPLNPLTYLLTPVCRSIGTGGMGKLNDCYKEFKEPEKEKFDDDDAFKRRVKEKFTAVPATVDISRPKQLKQLTIAVRKAVVKNITKTQVQHAF